MAFEIQGQSFIMAVDLPLNDWDLSNGLGLKMGGNHAMKILK